MSAPAAPLLAVSAAIVRDGRILILRRARPGEPGAGLFSFPGGRVEFGESLADALHREVREETSLTIEVLGLAGFREAILPAGGIPDAHFVILCFAARWRAGEPVLNEEHDAFDWVEPEALARLPTTPGLIELARIALAQGG